MSPPPGTAVTVGLLWFFVSGIVTYWTNIFLGGAIDGSAAYREFSMAFPPADFAMGVCAVTAAETLRRCRPTSVLWSLVTAGALGFIGLVDVTYNLQHQVYGRNLSTAWEVFVNVFSLLFPLWLAHFAWSRRRALDR